MKKFPCTGCGLCCANVGKLIAKADKEGLVQEPMRTLRKEFPIPINEDGSCSNYDHETRKCKDYHNRPIICNVDALFDRFFVNRGPIPLTDPANLPDRPKQRPKESPKVYYKRLDAWRKEFAKLCKENKYQSYHFKGVASRLNYHLMTALSCNQLMYDHDADKSFFIEDVI